MRARSPKVQQLTEGALARAEAPSAITEDESVWQSQTRVRSDAQTLPPTIPSIPPDPIFGGPAIDDAFDDAWESR